MNILTSIVPLLAIGVWVYALRDWYEHCTNRRDYWLIVIVFTNIIGYCFFVNSPDRQK